MMTDILNYAIGFGPAGTIANKVLVKNKIEQIFKYREKAIKEMFASAVHMIVQQSRLDDGSRKVLYITEIGGLQGEVVTLQDIFTYKQEGMGKDGKIIGKFMATGFIPKFIETLEKKGYKIPRGIFTNKQ